MNFNNSQTLVSLKMFENIQRTQMKKNIQIFYNTNKKKDIKKYYLQFKNVY